MRVAVIGAGIVGVTTAYELSADGHQVTVFERRSGVAAGASFANAGVIAPGYVTPWAAPGMAWKILRQWPRRHSAVRFGGWDALRWLPWMWQWWRACGAAVHRVNRASMQRLAQYSRERLQLLGARHRLDYEQAQGYLVLLRGAREMAAAEHGMALLRELGVRHVLLDAQGCREVEPALNAATPLAGAIHLPQDGVGNCRQFAHLMRGLAQDLGARFVFDRCVQAIVPGRVPEVVLGADSGPQRFEAVIVCAGHEANRVLGSVGIRLPLAPVHGYSITAPLRERDGAHETGPRSALMDERFKVAISRLGRRVRVAGSAEIGGTPGHQNAHALRTLYQVLDDWFPGATHRAQAQVWKGARPMLPDGPPLLGASGAEGVWLNLGHGSSGWALACGSARVTADLLARREPAIDLSGLGIERLRR